MSRHERNFKTLLKFPSLLTYSCLGENANEDDSQEKCHPSKIARICPLYTEKKSPIRKKTLTEFIFYKVFVLFFFLWETYCSRSCILHILIGAMERAQDFTAVVNAKVRQSGVNFDNWSWVSIFYGQISELYCGKPSGKHRGNSNQWLDMELITWTTGYLLLFIDFERAFDKKGPSCGSFFITWINLFYPDIYKKAFARFLFHYLDWFLLPWYPKLSA